MNIPSRNLNARPNLETLERRLVPTASISQNRNLYIDGTAAADTVLVREITVAGIDYYEVLEGSKSTRFKVTDISGPGDGTGPFVYFYGKGGNDSFNNQTPLLAVAHGGADNDTLFSVSGGFLLGEEGNDVLTSGAIKGETLLDGGPGNDTLTGGPGRDLMYGGEGNDTLKGMAGPDYLEGGAGNDSLDGGLGLDLLYGNDGNDTLIAGNDSFANQLDGGAGSDSLYGGLGADILWAGDDTSTNWLYGGAGGDTLYGGRGKDYLYGQAGSDSLQGRAGDDFLYGGAGLDYLWGQDGNDVLDGGIDGFADYLEGGTGIDWFRRELFFNGVTWAQREYRPDYNGVFDKVYG